MRRHVRLWATATRYALTEQGRNRFAMVLVACCIPLWITVSHAIMNPKVVSFRLRSTGQTVAAAGNEITQIVGALNSVTLIAGFMMFAASYSSTGFDRRLALAGFPRAHLVLAKLTVLVLVSAALTAYATALLASYWPARQPVLLGVGVFAAAITYGTFGVVFGFVLRREVEGMVAIAVTSVMDISLLHPMSSLGGAGALTGRLPSYGAVQASFAAGYSSDPAWSCLLPQLAWCSAAAAVSLYAFHRRTRSTLPRPAREVASVD